jgi:hypothetical protein
MNPYKPRPGTHAYAAIQYFQQNPDEEIATHTLADLLGVHPSKIPGLLHKAEHANCLAKSKLGNGYIWRMGSNVLDELTYADTATDAATDTPAEGTSAAIEGDDSTFSFALWHDGELMINGALQTETGIQLSVQQTASLVAYLTNMPGYLEYLGGHMAP